MRRSIVIALLTVFLGGMIISACGHKDGMSRKAVHKKTFRSGYKNKI